MVRIFRPPVFGSEDQIRHAVLVHRSVWTFFLLMAAFSLAATWILPANAPRWIELAAGCLAWTLLVSGINRSGHPWHASAAQVFFLWLGFSCLAWTGGGIHGPAAQAFVLVVLIAGSLLGWRAAVSAGIFCCLTLLGFVFAERLTILPPSAVASTSLGTWTADAFVLMIAGGIQYLSARSSKDALRISEQRFRGIFDSAYGFMGLLAPDGTLLEANRTALTLVGARQEDVIGKPFWETPWWNHSPTVQQELREQFARALAGETVCGEAEHRTHDGRLVRIEFTLKPVFDERGKVTLIIPEGREITERKRAESVLRESEARFRTLFDLVPYLMSVRDLDGRLLDANAKYREAAGLTREAIREHSISDVFDICRAGSGEPVTPDGKFLQEARVKPLELVLKNRISGEVRTALFRSEILELSGQPCFVTSAFDLTDLKHAEEEKTNLQAQLYQAQKMEAIGRLAAGVAHDFNNLLTVIGGYTQLILAKLSPEDEFYLSLLEVSKASRRAGDLTHQLLAFSRSQAAETAVVDLNALIRETQRMLRRLIGENIELKVDLAEAVPAVRADSGHLVQVLLNLAVNAGDAMPEGGLLTIETAVLDIGEDNSGAPKLKPVLKPKLKPGAYVRVRVRDTGMGMDSETQSHIFEPFFTTKEEGRGTGLGLSVVLGIVEQNGGSIAVSSQLGAGSEFEILLPAVERRMSSRERPPTEAILSGTETVLLADDDEAVRAFARQVMQEAGYRVLEAADGTQAMAIAGSHAGPIGLLVTDLRMPGIGGEELARRLRLEHSVLPVLFVSGHAGGEALEAACAIENAEFLRKPFAPNALLKHVRRTLDAR